MHVQGALTGIGYRDEFLQYHVIHSSHECQCGKFQDGRKEGRKEGRKKCFI